MSFKGFVPQHTKRGKTLLGRDQSDHELLSLLFIRESHCKPLTKFLTKTYHTKIQIDLIMQLTLKLSKCGICADAVDLSQILTRYDVAISHKGSPKFRC